MSNHKTFKLDNNFDVSYVECSKFKNFQMSFSFLLPMIKSKASLNAVLPGVLEYSCQKYPSIILLNKELENLYGTSLQSEVSKIGDYQVLTLSLNSLNEEFMNDISLGSLIDLITELIFYPDLDNRRFRSNAVEIEKNQIIKYIKSEFNDKRLYTFHNCEKLLYDGQESNIFKYGEIDSICEVSPSLLYDNYHDVLNSAYIKLIVIGNSLKTEVFDKFRNEIKKFKRSSENMVFKNKVKDNSDVKIKNKKEKAEVEQCKFAMGFNTGVSGINEESVAMILMNFVLGGTPSSKLFLNVREKLNLCYYCSSRFDKYKGSVFVESGVENKNLEKAKEEILKQIDSIKKGNLTNDEIEDTKKFVCQMYENIEDSLDALDSWYLSQTLNDALLTPHSMAEKLKSVRIEEVVEAAGKLKLDSIYTVYN
ncbi:MAG: insulinase family protein [Candidatus Improbicoccus pseudotrichonymphae]|uniref:Insulinase family protein n=1 Tax=Candidatus Improbicoccus pseudotrichonymphae TaxID=3033792 RepID=A0AA48I0L7_9FIRM|nr:MAG: insulinase family protein [Candidatus Improbicoccus pseudotrichonymphae]